jgi:mannose-binding lectin 2
MTATNWQIEVEFKIHSKEGHLHGDGMAIWLIEERGKPGKVFGHTDNFNGLGIFIDTYKNQRPGVTFPYVMAMLGNSSVSYDKDHDGKANELAGCSVFTGSLEKVM